MEVKSCRRCNALFHHVVGPPLCQKCLKKDEEDFQRVKEYLYDNPGAAMATVCEVLDVSVRQIKQYLREGRLTVSADSPIGLDCERCNARITTGKYCDKCIAEMSNQFSSTARGMQKVQAQSTKKDSGSKMRYLSPKSVKRKG